MAVSKRIVPGAFLSYAHLDDAGCNKITTWYRCLQSRIEAITRNHFPIYCDRDFIGPGQDWEKQIGDHLESAMFLLPIVSPAFFGSGYCRYEVDTFTALERRRGSSELVIPFLFMDSPQLADPTLKDDPLVALVRERQYLDLCRLQDLSTDSEAFTALVDAMASRVVETIRRIMADGGLSQSAPDPVRPERIVDAAADGAAASIRAALLAALPGDRILVRPGIYRESLVIDKPVELIGDGAVDDIVIQGSGTATVTFAASHGRISGLTLLQLPNPDSRAHALAIVAGAPTVEHCVISSKSLSCISMREKSSPIIRGNRIVGGATFGIAASGQTRGLIEDNEIAECANVLIAITESASPTLRRNTVREGMNFGVSIGGDAVPLLEDNQISHNANCGVLIAGQSAPTLRRNHVHSNQNFGISIGAGTAPLLQDNTIVANANSGVLIRAGSSATVRDNRIHDNQNFGIAMSGAARTLLEGNHLGRNLHGDIMAENGADPTVRGNRLDDACNEAICFTTGSTGLIEDNQIRASLISGISLRSGAAPVVRANRIADGKAFGINVSGGATGTIENNEISGSGLAGLRIDDHADPIVRANRIHDCAGYGVMISGSGRGRLQDNEVSDNAKSGVQLDRDAAPRLQGNRIHGNGGFGLLFMGEAKDSVHAVIANNRLDDNRVGARSDDEASPDAAPASSAGTAA